MDDVLWLALQQSPLCRQPTRDGNGVRAHGGTCEDVHRSIADDNIAG